MNRRLLVPALLSLAGLTACVPVVMTAMFATIPQKLYFHPVAGPGAATGGTAMKGSASGVTSGSMTVTLADGERCQGTWSRVDPDQAQRELSDAWDHVYGAGFFTRAVLGARDRIGAKLVGDRGTVIEVACIRPDLQAETRHRGPLQGVARDSAGTVYKVTE